jgi:hypothetical protein
MNINDFKINPFTNVCVICNNHDENISNDVKFLTIEYAQLTNSNKYLIFHYCNEHFPYHKSTIDLSVLNSKFELIKKYQEPFNEDLKNSILKELKKFELLK